MSIKPKIGNCIDCGKYGPLISKRCQQHYWSHRTKANKARDEQRGVTVDKQAQKTALNKWFDAKIRIMPDRCENCNMLLDLFAPWAARSFVAHILPKAIFESVATHPDNCIYLCLECHENFDRRGWEAAASMPVFAIAMERATTVLPCVSHEERRLLPECFQEGIDGL